MNMKNRSHRYVINRPRSRRGHKYRKYKRIDVYEGCDDAYMY